MTGYRTFSSQQVENRVTISKRSLSQTTTQTRLEVIWLAVSVVSHDGSRRVWISLFHHLPCPTAVRPTLLQKPWRSTPYVSCHTLRWSPLPSSPRSRSSKMTYWLAILEILKCHFGRFPKVLTHALSWEQTGRKKDKNSEESESP